MTDFKLSGRGPDVRWRRIYRTDSAENGPLGRGWQFNYNQFLVRGQPSATQPQILDIIAFNDGIGRGFAYKRVNIAWIAPKNVTAKLTEQSDGSFMLTEKEGTVRTFYPPTLSQVGRLKTYEDRKGNVITFTYDVSNRLETIIDTLGRTITVGYHSTGRIKSVQDWMGRTWWYGYNDDDELETVVSADPDDDASEYGYVSTYTYDDDHMMLSATWPEGLRFSNTYDPSDLTLIGHDRGNGSWSISYLDHIEVVPVPSGAPVGYHLQYGSSMTAAVTDRNGNLTQYRIGPSKSFQWIDKKTNRGINSEDPWNFRTYYEYVNSPDEASGSPSLFSVTTADGITKTRAIDANNRTVERSIQPSAAANGEVSVHAPVGRSLHDVVVMIAVG